MRHNMRGVWAGAAVACALCAIAQADVDSAFQNGLKYAESERAEVQQWIRPDHFDPHTIFKGYSDQPDAARYYQDPTQPSDNGLDQDAANQVEQNGVGGAIERSALTRPVIKISADSPEIKKGALIEFDADDIARGISDRYVDCERAQQCTTTYVKKTCDEAVRTTGEHCTDTPTVTIINAPQPFPNCQHLAVLTSGQGLPAGSRQLGPWDLGNVWLIPGADAGGRCAAAYAYALGLEAQAQGAAATVPPGFAATLTVQRSDDFCHRYGKENMATLTTQAGQSLVASMDTMVASAPLAGQSPDQAAAVQLSLKNHHWYRACNLASLGEVLVPSQINVKQPEVTWNETCTD